jgi:hypothetical protein
MSNNSSPSNFCQFGGNDSNLPPAGVQLKGCKYQDKSLVSIWMVCMTCYGYLESIGDPTIFVLCKWGRELSYSKKLPVSIRETPLIHTLLIQYLDEILNNKMRQRFGTRFPAFLSDLKSSEKDYFIQTLEQDSTLSEVFIPDVEQGAERLSIALKMWVGGITAAKATRKTYRSVEGEKEYTLEQRRTDFELADSYAKKDEIFRAGVQVAPILELIIRKKRNISLVGAKRSSSIWKYVRTIVDSKSVNQDDLLVCSGCILDI